MNFAAGRKLFFPYLLADHPSPRGFRRLLDMATQHADLVEIGIPFSDPVADGPVIREASQAVLRRGFRVRELFDLLRSRAGAVPVALMTYANPVLAFGPERFLDGCAESRVAAVIVPDMPFEEDAGWRELAGQRDIRWISFVSLMTGSERLQRIASAAQGFLYLVSVTGITGTHVGAREAIRCKARSVRHFSHVPLALGFGIKSPEDAVPFLDCIDAFIVGSRIVELVRQDAELRIAEEFFTRFCNIIRNQQSGAGGAAPETQGAAR
jgi:tryptophan synthase alpha chain